MPAIDLSILNQRQTPAFYADTLANRPAAGFVGRIFVSTNTFAFYRDNGTSWDLIGGPGTGTITGSGAAGQVSYWNGASTITGSNDLFFDAVNGHLGIGTVTPGTALSIDHDQNTLIQLQQTVATNDTRIAFINNGVGLWRLGTFYNAGANDFALFDVTNSISRISVSNTGNITLIGTLIGSNATFSGGVTATDFRYPGTGFTTFDALNTGGQSYSIRYGLSPYTTVFNINPTVAYFTPQVLIGTQTPGSGKLVVASATGDNGVQIVGASAPSLRIDNAESGPTKRVGLGISTATNNFIQGSADRDFCIFNGSTTASPILFGIYGTTNVLEAARISAARNFLIGTTTDLGQKLQVSGTAYISGNVGIGTDIPQTKLQVDNSGVGAFTIATIANRQARAAGVGARINILPNSDFTPGSTTGAAITAVNTSGTSSNNVELIFETSSAGTGFEAMRITGDTRNLLIGTTTDAGQKLQVNGTARISSSALISKSLINSVNVGTVAALGSSTVTIISAKTGNISLGATIVITGFENQNNGAIIITANIIGNWAGGSLNKYGIGTIVSNESLGGNDYRGYGQLVPTVGTSGNSITITLTNLQLSSITDVSIAIIENSN
jgi:hypothetical protein